MSYAAYIFDLDGTLYRGNAALPYAVEVVAGLRSRGALIRYLTNNSSQTRSSYVEKLRGMGFDAEETEIYSSATGTACYCLEAGVRSAFVVGDPGLIETLIEAGIRVVNGNPEAADAVIAGICRAFSYDLCTGAMQHILAGARFIATNTDATYPLEEGRLIPGAGAIIAAIRECSGVEPFVVGKPNPYLIELILRDAGLRPHEALVVGDRVETDIEAAKRAGCPAHLVLTGVTTEPVSGVTWSRNLLGLPE